MTAPLDKKKRLILEDKNIYKGLGILALPLMLSYFFKAVHDLIDTFFVGQLENSVQSQAAIAISSPLINAILALFTGLGIGVVALVSRAVGRRDKAKAKRLTGSALTVGLILSAASFALCFWACPPLLRFFASGETLSLADMYVRVRAFELPAFAIAEVFRGCRQAQGDTVAPVIYSGVSVAVNIALTAVLVNLGFGLYGAAIATVISQYAAAPLCALGLFRSKKYLTVTPRSLIPKAAEIKPLLKTSAPAAVSGALASVGFLVLQYFVRGHGDETVAAFSICNRITNILVVPAFALGSVLTAFIGQNLGGGSAARAEKAYAASRNLTLIITAAAGTAVYFARAPLIALLTSDAEVHSAAGEYMLYAAAAMPLVGLFQNYCGAYNGYGKTGYTFVMESARLWALRLPLVALFNALGMGRAGIWYAMVASNVLICVLGFILYRIVKRKSRKNEKRGLARLTSGGKYNRMDV